MEPSEYHKLTWKKVLTVGWVPWPKFFSLVSHCTVGEIAFDVVGLVDRVSLFEEEFSASEIFETSAGISSTTELPFFVVNI